ncbi:MAG: sigma-54 dependent transcriptional regulator [Planctomycetes bacterium]|nr:sigma-54 dependent transcriptional regulator [Planctomycetota bacterium]
MSRILIADDDEGIRSALASTFEKQGHETLVAASGEEALGFLRGGCPDLLLIDLRMPGLSGLETLERVRAACPEVPVILMTAYGSTEAVIEAMKLGASDYVAKPFDPADLLARAERALLAARLARSVPLPGPRTGPEPIDGIVANCPMMLDVLMKIGRVAPSDTTVLVRGESGTGKELVARAIHRHGRRARHPFIVVHCAAIPDTLLESELFGHEKGAFTGASARKIGRFEQAHGGTVFLDEIGDMSPAIQARILRVVQHGTLERLGGGETIRVDARVISATHRPLEAFVREGRFREDLYYRLSVFTISLPPLRERGDIPLLAEHFLRLQRARLGKPQLRLSPGALERLLAYPWPGNVRELEHALQQAAILSAGGAIQPEHLRLEEHAGPPRTDVVAAIRHLANESLSRQPGSAHGSMVDLVERHAIVEALRRTCDNLARSARLLGISRPTLRSKIRALGIERRERPETNGTNGSNGSA